MAISQKLRDYMQSCDVAFEEVPHPFAFQPSRAAEASHLPGKRVAKAVLVRAGDRYMLAVVPSSRRVHFGDLSRWMGRDDLSLAEEDDAVWLFGDCDRGALPPVGSAYGIQTVLDDAMLNADDVYFEGGDHKTLVHMKGEDWRRLQQDAGHCPISA